MTPSRKRVSISLKLTVFLIVWTAGTLAAVAVFYAAVARDIRTYHRVFEAVAAEAQQMHRLLDGPAPLGTVGRERFRALGQLSDSAMAALQNGGNFQGIACKPIPAELRELFDEIANKWKPTRRDLDALLASTEAEEPAARRALHVVYPRWQADVQRMRRSLVRREGTIRTHTIDIFAVICAANAVLLALVLWLVRRFITSPVQAVHAAASRIATGDFSTPVTVAGNDEIGELAAEVNRMSGRLEETMSALRESADALATSNRELEEYGYAAAHDLRRNRHAP
jgi:methyl-accepting chemotaxis protein